MVWQPSPVDLHPMCLCIVFCFGLGSPLVLYFPVCVYLFLDVCVFPDVRLQTSADPEDFLR